MVASEIFISSYFRYKNKNLSLTFWTSFQEGLNSPYYISVGKEQQDDKVNYYWSLQLIQPTNQNF